MMLKLLSVLLYRLRWLAWAFHYLIVWPAATLMLLVAMLLWMENTTPGEAMAQEIMSVTHNVSSGEFRIAACLDEPLQPFIPPAPQNNSSGLTLHHAPSAVCQDRGSVVTDAKGYAVHVNDSLRVVTGLWIVMAIVFSGAALLMGCRPYFCLYGQMRSAWFRYGIPASRPAPATEAVKTADNKKEDNRE
ncbi:conjugal transfer protein TraP [Salmonella enterica]|nr:conjugal transfer protein TraP [Salmonella enterica subsp. enterica serovar Pomona]EEU6435155.1 conjugal transfer protein TraP [Salmonella enterica]EIJ8479603.1 conjugal transfer protein TraP [Salmonella enterica]EIM9913678.1 conjugal transfer protein TraP [Salmonella enterica]EIT0240984.1 conjugal transfer protein TraP [Salmonella enterica]